MKQYTVTGMSCAACSARVEKAVSKVDGVTSCSVSLLTNSMGVEGSATDAQIVEAVEQAGYGASPKGTATESDNDKANNSLEQLKAAQDALVDRETPKLCKQAYSIAHILRCSHVFFYGTYDVGLAVA